MPISPYDGLSAEDMQILKSSFDAGIWGPFFRGLLWKDGDVAVYTGQPMAALEILSRHWPNLESREFYLDYRSAELKRSKVADEPIFISCTAAFSTIIYWMLDYWESTKSEEVVEVFENWIQFERETVVHAYQRSQIPYRAWIGSLRA